MHRSSRLLKASDFLQRLPKFSSCSDSQPHVEAHLYVWGLVQVRVVEFNATTPFKEQLEIMASTAVLISVHTSNLANAPFLQPGSAVIELIQRNWIWHNLDRSFQVPHNFWTLPVCEAFRLPCTLVVVQCTECRRPVLSGP